jgi:predicted enzyme related to lactoylglutathione lyase
VACRFTELVVDCRDQHRLGEFWSAVLGYRISDRSDGPEHFYVELEGPPGAGPSILLLRTADTKTTKNRLHIDVNATDRDQDAEVERVLALGASRVDIGQGEQTWVVLADPEGNEFCVLREVVEPHPRPRSAVAAEPVSAAPSPQPGDHVTRP